MSVAVPEPLKRFIWDIQSMVELADSEREILLIGGDLMRRLVSQDGWIPEPFSRAGAVHAQHFLLFRDAMERFAVTATVLAEGQAMLARQEGVWEIYGVLRGALSRGVWPQENAPAPLPAGAAETAGSRSGGSLRLAAAAPLTIAIHVYGGEIGAMARFALEDEAMGEALPFANPEEAPPYDIFTIQTVIAD
jgi:3-mercaptopropionate dioxygenase